MASTQKVPSKNPYLINIEEQGAVYQWKKIDEIHCGFNIGKQTKYTYHFIGKKKDGPSYHHFY